MSTAGILIIGNEVLSGKVEEQNARYLVSELRELGVGLMRIVFVRDDVPTITKDVREMAAAFDHVFTTGGVGSTHDDVTLDAVAKAFEVPLEPEPSLLALLEAHYGERLNDPVRRMAMLPRGAELLGLQELRHPIVKVRNVYVFPGVPEFLRAKFDFLKGSLRTAPFVLRQLFLSVGEDRIAIALSEIAQAFPDLELGSYPRFDVADHRVKLTIEGREAVRVEDAARALRARLEPAWIVREG